MAWNRAALNGPGHVFVQPIHDRCLFSSREVLTLNLLFERIELDEICLQFRVLLDGFLARQLFECFASGFPLYALNNFLSRNFPLVVSVGDLGVAAVVKIPLGAERFVVNNESAIFGFLQRVVRRLINNLATIASAMLGRGF